MNINPNQRIYDVMQAIHQGHYHIPNIQRGYEWNQERVTKLLDSIMSGYPIGAIMVWRPTEEIRGDIMTRPFIQKYDSSQDYLSDTPHPADQDPYLVLDGQQRLQSLYISFFGSYDGQRVYLKIDHIPTDDDGDTDYIFEFLLTEEARSRPEMIHLMDIVDLDSETKFEFAEQLAQKLCAAITDDTERTAMVARKRINISKNIDRFLERFNMRSALLFQEVEKRHNYDHVLEIFERVNSGGMVLDKSDLLFSTLKLKLQEMERRFIDTITFLNQGNRHSFNTDFLIKACLVIFDQRAKYDVVKLKNNTFTNTLKSRYSDLHTCLRQMSAWLDDMGRIKCNRFLRSRLALIPILDYMYLSGNYDKPDGENSLAMTEYLYMAFFRRLLSRTPDNVLDQLHALMVSEVAKDHTLFPIKAIRAFMVQRQNAPYQFEDYFLYNDPDLILNIVDGGVLQIDPADPAIHPKDLKLEVDHIFPRSRLVADGQGDLANHIGNYRLIVMPANRRKSARMPDQTTAFFGRNHPDVEPLYQQALVSCSREHFQAFRDARTALIRAQVGAFLGFGHMSSSAA